MDLNDLSSGTTRNIFLELPKQYFAFQAPEKIRSSPKLFKKRFFLLATCNIKKFCCNTAEKSNCFDFTAVLQQQKYVSCYKTYYDCHMSAAAKRDMIIIFEETSYLLKRGHI